MGEEAVDAAPALIQAVPALIQTLQNDQDGMVRDSAVEALGQIGKEDLEILVTAVCLKQSELDAIDLGDDLTKQ